MNGFFESYYFYQVLRDSSECHDTTLRNDDKFLNIILNNCNKLMWISDIDCNTSNENLTVTTITKSPNSENLLENKTLRIVPSRPVNLTFRDY